MLNFVMNTNYLLLTITNDDMWLEEGRARHVLFCGPSGPEARLRVSVNASFFW